MMTKVNSGDVGIALADCGDEEQASFLNSFATTLRRCCHRNGGSLDMQLCYIAKLLDKDGRMLINELAKFTKDED